MKKKNDSSGSERSVGDDGIKYVAGAVRNENPTRSSIGRSNLVERARAFDPKFDISFSEGKFSTHTAESARRSSWANLFRSEKEPAFLFVSPTLSDQRRKSMEERILGNMRDEQNLLLSRRTPPKTVPRLPKHNRVGPNMKALLDASEHRRTNAVKPVHLRMTNAVKSIFVDKSPINKYAFKLKKVCAPKLKVSAEAFQPPVNPKTSWQRSLLHKAINDNFLLKNTHKKTEEALVDAMETVTVPKGGILAKQGDSSEQEDNFYVLQEGKVEFLLDNQRVKTAKAGESFGEERLLLRVPNETTVKAMESSILLRLNQYDFRSIMEKTIAEEWEEESQRGKKEQAEASTQQQARKVHKKDTHKPIKKIQKPMKQKTKKEKKPKGPELFDPKSLEKHSMEFKRQVEIRRSIKKHAKNWDDLEFISVLGEGQFGEVWLVAAILPNIDPSRQEFALKIQNKNDEEIRDDAVAEIYQEINVLKQIHHPFIVNLVNVYESEESIDMLLGLIPGGELWDQIHVEDEHGKWTSGISERRARFISYVLADTLAFLHSRELLFRDLKPENIMIDKDGYPILIDFGFAKKVPKGSLTFTFCGTPNYVAPEIIQNTGQSVGVDHWALGVVIYEMISGENPFFCDDMCQVELYETIVSEAPYAMRDDKAASNQVLNIIDKLLQKNPKKRLGYDSPMELLLDPWFKGMPDLNEIRTKRVKAPTEEDADQTLSFEEENTFASSKEAEDMTLVEEKIEEDVVVVGELPLSPVKTMKDSSKWIINSTSKGKLKGYYMSPKTPLQRTTSRERRDLLNKKLVDVISLDGNAVEIDKPTKKHTNATKK
ncbi:serine/threonine protein kinase [Nitzschia inconspicua]|uniref:Serine/threonine protein kinase n=1 Tax=Nitzschia inconspicua TaxID=303405 RepID=A0A9K3KLR9_9STRA|nr:serine/threonine protein kinase [Nitzschia inconspicua]